MAVWMTPVMLAGFPYILPATVLHAKQFAATGILPYEQSAFITLFLRLFHPLIAWENVVGWTVVSAGTLAAALLPFWWMVRRLFGTATAWIAVVIFSFMPLYWTEAVLNVAYPMALFFLFLGFALFLGLVERHRITAVAVFGLCMGAVLHSSHAFLTFLPWLVIVYFWFRRRQWVRGGAELGISGVFLCIALALPLLPNALVAGLAPAERIAAVIPSPAEHTTGIWHLYPDEFTYTFLRDEFEQIMFLRDAEAPLLTRLQDRYTLMIFGKGDTSVVGRAANGLWLFLNTLPHLFLQEYVGGIFLWLFIVPGLVVLWRRRRSLLVFVTGLWLSTEFLLRFVLHYGRTHLMDWGWALPVIAAVGVVTLADLLHERWKRVPAIVFAIVMALVIAGQMVQVNRQLFARNYARSSVPASYAAAEALAAIPSGAIVAHPRGDELFYFSDRSHVVIATQTVEYLAEHGRLREPFVYHNVTHILGYDAETAALITRAVPGIRVVAPAAVKMPVTVTPLIRYLLHLIR